MKSSPNNLQLLGLTDVESRIFDVLSFNESESVTTLSSQAKIPRTSALSALERLSERGLVRKVSTDQKTLWKKTNPEKLRRSVANLFTELEVEEQLEQLEKEVAIKVSTQSEFTIVKGARNILKFQEKGTHENLGERVFLAQGSKTGETVAKLGLAKDFSRLNTLIKERGIITELLVSERTLDWYQHLMKQDEAWRTSMHERLVILYAVSSDLLADSAIDVIVHKKRATIINWQEETMVVIKNKDTMKLFKNWFEILSSQAQKIDPTRFFN